MKTIKLFNNVIIVHGSSRDLLFDMLTEKYYFIPKSMTCYLNSNNVFENKNITKDIIFEYEKFIKENNLGYKLIRRNSSNYFLNKMSKTYDFPSIVTNFVLHFDYCKNISVRALSSFGVYALVIIVDKMINTSVIDLFISSVQNSSIATVELIVFDDEYIDIESLFSLFKKYPIIVKIICHAKNEKTEITPFGRIFKTTNKSIELCSKIDRMGLFASKILFCESQKYNTCLNRKLCIDKDGYIKNCPSMEHHYGHISNTKIEDVVNLPEFQKWWHIKKDDIDVCKDCEFRHMCTDCRAFIKDPENIYSQPAKCTYNPYICKWEGEDGYVPVEECGTYSRETGFVPDKKKIKKLNKQIWGDE